VRSRVVDFQQFVSSKPFPYLETCIRNLNKTSARSLEYYGSDPQYASLLRWRPLAMIVTFGAKLTTQELQQLLKLALENTAMRAQLHAAKRL